MIDSGFDKNSILHNINYSLNNRAFKYGDSIFETIKIINGKIMLLEYHFKRIKSSMEFLNFNIPFKFSEEFIENLIKKNIPNKNKNYRLRLDIFRDSEGLYIPYENNIKISLNFKELLNISYIQDVDSYNIGIYDKLYIQKSPLSNIKTNNRLINVMAGIELKKNPILHNILLLNDDKNISEAYNSNIFCIKNNEIYTPKLEDGCINGVFRNFLIDNFDIKKISINTDLLLDFDEIFLTNSIQGIVLVKKIFTKTLKTSFSKEIFGSLIKILF